MILASMGVPMLTITNVTQPDPTNAPQTLEVTCSTGAFAASPAPVPAPPGVVTCWAELDGNEVTLHVPAALQSPGSWLAILDLQQLGPNYFADTTYTVFATTVAETTNTEYTTLP